MSKNNGRRDNNNTAKQTNENKGGDTQQETKQVLEGSVEGQGTDTQSGDQSTAIQQTGTEGSEGTSEGSDKPEQKPAPKAPNFASNKAPASMPSAVKLFKELVGEYAKGNPTRQMDQGVAKRVTRGLCTAFQQLGKLNANDTKTCLAFLHEAIKADKGGAFTEGVMFRYASAVPKTRLYVDILNVAKRYVSLGDAKSNITRVVDVSATAEHYTSKVVQAAIVDFYK